MRMPKLVYGPDSAILEGKHCFARRICIVIMFKIGTDCDCDDRPFSRVECEPSPVKDSLQTV